MVLSKMTQANFSAESIIHPVFRLLQGSGIFGRPPRGGVRRALRPVRPPMCSGSHEEERRALALVCPVRLGRYLLVGWTPLLDMGDREAKPNEHVDVGRESPMLLDDPFGEPISGTWAFIQVAFDRPNLVARSVQ